MQFESLVELINYYERHPLYKKVKLTYPVNEGIVERNFQVSKWNTFTHIFISIMKSSSRILLVIAFKGISDGTRISTTQLCILGSWISDAVSNCELPFIWWL